MNKIKFCIRCCTPSTMEGVRFDSLGICTACKSSEDKMHINWKQREKELKKILDKAKKKSRDNYDCVLPISGGKDSFFQAHVLVKKYNLKPLAVTFSHNWFTEVGFYNLQRCLQVFNLDHIQFTPARNLVNKLAKKSLSVIGDSCWHCHMGVGSFPLHIATKFKIPLIIYGESIRENHGRARYSDNKKLKYDKDYFLKISARKSPNQLVDKNLSKKDMFLFNNPKDSEIKKTDVYGIHLGDYLFWDDERQTEWIKKEYGWKETQMEGTYKRYKSVECIMSGMHDFTCYLKRGFGRATWQVIMDVRRGALTREEGFELIKKHDSEIPNVLEYYLDITGLTNKDFFKIINKQKHPDLKTTKLKIKKKTETRMPYPFVESIIDKHLKRNDE